MANWYVLDGTADGQSYRIAYLIPIPNTSNSSGVNFQTALINSGIGGKNVMTVGTGPGQMASADAALITSGAAFQVVDNFVPTGLPQATLAAAIDARLAQLTTQYQAALANILKWFGASGI